MPTKKRKKTEAPATGDGSEPDSPPGVKLLRTLEGRFETVWGLAFDPEGQTLASASDVHTVKLWDTRTGSLIRTLEEGRGKSGGVFSLAFAPQGRTLASATSGYSVRLWDLSTSPKPDAENVKLHRTFEGHTRTVSSLAFDPRGRTLPAEAMTTQ